MRRAALAIVSTIAGLVLLLSFKTQSPAAVSQPPTAIAGTPSSAPAATVTAPTAAPTAAPSTSPPAATTKTVTGRAYDTRYGPVQVQVRVTGGTLMNVTAVQLPQGRSRDIELDNYAVPILREEALAAQSADIAMVSGATYTSAGYLRSLQSALDRAKA